MNKVKVYYFECYDIIKDEMIRSKHAATIETIKRYNGNPLMETVNEVESTELDEDGFIAKK